MATGQIGFHRQKQVKKVLVEKRVNEIINRLNKTKVEKFPDLAAEKAEFEKEERRREKAALQEKVPPPPKHLDANQLLPFPTLAQLARMLRLSVRREKRKNDWQRKSD